MDESQDASRYGCLEVFLYNANISKSTVMNRFLVFKKHKASSPVETTNDTPEKRSWRRKKPVQDPKPQINVSNVLPPSDQFRQSLMMPNLSARFSMLREQDDPNSVIGKASDDSVLQPKRKSRLIDFGAAAGTLSDIAEVSSTIDSIMPSIPAPRKSSYTYGQRTPPKRRVSLEESVMNRGRGELPGNVSPRGSPLDSPRKTPRKKSIDMLNEDPPKISPFKQYLRKAELEDFKRQHRMDDASWTQEVLASPKLSFDDKRKTRSSTTSGPSSSSFSTIPTPTSPLRLSSAAMLDTPDTTVTSSPAVSLPGEMQAAKTMKPDLQRKQSQRLYGQSLMMHTSDQRTAALTRLTSIRRNPSTLARSGPINIHQDSVEQNGVMRRPRPQLGKLTTFDSVRRPRVALEEEPDEPLSPSFQSPPLSPFDEMAENINPLYSQMNASERGKATAMGLFSKPEKFDERQYLQRQLSLMQQQRPKRRSTLSPKKPTFPGKSSPLKSLPRRGKPPMPRRGTDASDRSWTAGSDDVFTILESDKKEEDMIKTDSAIDTADIIDSIPEIVEEEQEPATEIGSADTPASLTRPDQELRRLPTHPALRLADLSQNARARSNGWSPDRLLEAKSSSPEEERDLWPSNDDENTDPMLPTSPKVADLKGLVSSHLRHQSNASSFYAPAGHVPSMYMSACDSSDDFEKLMQRGLLSPKQPASHLSVRPPPQVSKRPSSVTLRDLITEEETKTGTQDLVRQHARGGSSETQYERRAFADELAQRQKTIQENLKIKVEHESRSNSPAASSRSPLELPLKPFAMLKAKTSRDSLSPSKQEQPTRGQRWVDMSIGTSAESKTVTKDREPLSPGIGRTLHSELKPASVDTSRAARKEKERAARKEAERGINSNADSKDVPLSPISTTGSAASTTATRPSGDNTRSSGDSNDRKLSKVITPTSLPPAAPTSASPHPPSLPPPKAQLNINIPPIPSPPPPTPASTTSRPSRAPPLPRPVAVAKSPATLPPPPPKPISTSAQLLRRRAHAYTHQLHLPSYGSHHADSSSGAHSAPAVPHINKSYISEPTLLASTFPGDTVDLPSGASLRNGMRGDNDVDAVLAARGGGGIVSGKPVAVGMAMAMGRSASAGIVKEEKERERVGGGVGRLQPFLARVGRSVSADKERERGIVRA